MSVLTQLFLHIWPNKKISYTCCVQITQAKWNDRGTRFLEIQFSPQFKYMIKVNVEELTSRLQQQLKRGAKLPLT